MADLDRVAIRVSEGLRRILARLTSLAFGIAETAAVIGLATFVTGWWVFDGSRPTWTVVGGALCLAPCLAAVIAWLRVRRTVRVAPDLVGEVRTLMEQSKDAAQVLITYDAEDRLITTAKTFEPVRSSLVQRRDELPALWAGIRAITTLPGLAAIAVLGTLAVGALGTILLIGGLID